MRINDMQRAPICPGTRTLVRVDVDIPLRNGAIADDFRIKEIVPTLKELLRRGAHLRLIGHIGRPEAKAMRTLSMMPVVRRLGSLINANIICIKNPFDKKAFASHNGSSRILMFENIRFWPGEEKNDASFAAHLALWGDIYINEAFANCHRNHASMVGIPQLLPSFAGSHLISEIKALQKILHNPIRPFVAILGGAKLETKVPLIERFLREADRLLIGGAIANTFFALQGLEIGRSISGKKGGESGRKEWLGNPKLHLPLDVVVSKKLTGRSRGAVRTVGEVKKDEYIVDIGPSSAEYFCRLVKNARTLVWNGPLGYAEVAAFAKGTELVARSLKQVRGYKVVGGGDSVTIIRVCGLEKNFTHVSTGGGAMLDFLANGSLPAIDALRK